MSRSPSLKRRLSVEPLEIRDTPTGTPWLDAANLSLSFVPDGTAISGQPSNLFAQLGGTPTAAWEREVLRAFQTWAVQTNINIGLTPDSGLPMGVPGAPQKDPRFGDIRIGGRPLAGTAANSMAETVPYDYAAGTWSGDVILNTSYPFGIGDVPGRQSDLYSVLLHEAGHSLFGFPDVPANPTTVMNAAYSVYTGLTPVDVAAAQAMYGVRTPDPYEGPAGNGSLATAYDMTQNGNLTSLNADITAPGEVDSYRFTTPAALTPGSPVTVTVQAAGVSLLTPRVTVYSAAGAVIGTAASTDPLNNNVSVTIPAAAPGTSYYVQVQGAGTDVFSQAGAYVLRVQYPTAVGVSAVNLFNPAVNGDTYLNGALTAAQPLTPVWNQLTNTFAVLGGLFSPTQTDWYRVTPTGPAGAVGTLTVSVWSWVPNGLLPSVQVYNAQGVQVPANVVANENGTFTVQVPNQVYGTTYNLMVSAANPAGVRATGGYVLGATLGQYAADQSDALGGGSLTTAAPTQYATLTVGDDRLVQFVLTADAGGADAAVGMTVYNAQGQSVFTTAVRSGSVPVTGTVWLPAGTYTVAYTAATRTGTTLPAVAYTVRKRELSDPMDPILSDPTTTPTGPTSPPVVISPPPTPSPTPPGPISGPITNPYTVIA